MTIKKGYKYDHQEILENARGNWIRIFSILASNTFGKALGEFTGSNNIKARDFCPIHGGKSGKAFYLFNDANETGGGGCNSCGSHTNGISLLMWAKNWEFKDCLKEVSDALNMKVPDNISYKSHAAKSTGLSKAQIEIDKKTIWARDKIIQECLPLSSKEAASARLYFSNRGLIDLSLLGKEVLFHPGLDSWRVIPSNKKGEKPSFIKEGTFPAIVCIIRDSKGKVLNIHRTYLTPNGYKADIESPRKMGKEIVSVPVTGGSVHICPPATTIGVAEGLETTLAALIATNLSMSCVLNTSLMKSWLPPVGVKRVVIFADNDANNAGIVAAQVLYEKLEKRGYECIIALPHEEDDHENVDWADVLKLYGPEGFPEIPPLELSMLQS